MKQALDQLIDSHHANADHTYSGLDQPGPGINKGMGAGVDRAQYVVVQPQDKGTTTGGPYLIGVPIGPAMPILC